MASVFDYTVYPIINIMLNRTQRNTSKKENGQRFCFVCVVN